MKFINIILGTIITTIGAAIGYIDYYIISMFYTVSLWLSELVNAPAAVAVVLTLVLIVMFIAILLIIAIIASYIIIVGLIMILDN